MPPKLPKLVPWHSPAEFIQVYEWFYPSPLEDGTTDIRAQECALRRIRAWEARGKLPHAIDSTAAFVQAVVRDWTQNLTDQELRLMYSMVFIRFVNGYVDAFQSAKTAKSIAYLAVEKVGMPVWFVELRHTATHDYLPSLAILRSATHQALAWINENYWMPQLVSVRLDEKPSEEMKSAMSDDVRQIMEAHRTIKEKQIEENSLPQPKQEHIVISRLVRELVKRCGSGDELLDTLVPILLEPGMLVPKSKKMRASARDLNLDSLGRMVDYCWMPLMARLHLDLSAMSSTKDGEVLSFWVSLVNGMLDKLIEANAPSGTTAKAGSYLITISTPRLSVAAMAAQLVAEQAAQQPPAMFDNDDIINIVEDCLENSLTNVSPLLRSVLNTVIESDAEIKERIGPILKQIDQRLVSGASTSAPVATAPTPVSHDPAPGWEVAEQSVATSSEGLDVEMTDTTETMTQATNHNSVEATGSWTMFDAETWRPCPIGCLPGGILPDLSLPWELDSPPIARVDLTGY
ncbi:rRNA-processing protein las1 [Podila verticillata]|nr:rRNA-processing protein las1 [Podila verticillata]KAF9373943.1 rRNA-processing protein las1 [Podila verticillata]